MKTTLAVVSFSPPDLEADSDFARIPTEKQYGHRSFPSPESYRQKVKEIASRGKRGDIEPLYALAQRDWHVRGQTGCMFARLAALQASTLRWIYLVTNYAGDDIQAAQQIKEAIQSALAEESVEVVSVLLPTIDRAGLALGAIRELVATSAFWIEKESALDGILNIHVRCPVRVSGARVDAWVMAFAPFDFMPNTRRGPFFELTIRAKQKPSWIFHRLNQDRAVAHLADVPLQMSGDHWEHRWQSTMRRTRMILGGEPNNLSAAKSTIAIPISLVGGDAHAGSRKF